MDEREFVAAHFEEHRTRLRAVAYRMLGSLAVVGDLESLAAVLTSRPGGSAVIRGPAWWRRSVLEVVLGVAAYGFAVEPLAADR